MKKDTLFCFLIVFNLYGCAGIFEEKSKTIYIDLPEMDSVIVQMNHSGEGSFVITSDSIAFFDKNFCTVSVADLKTFSFGRPRLGLKDSVLHKQNFVNAFSQNGQYYALSNYKIWSLNKSGTEIQKLVAITFPTTQSGKMLETEPSPRNPAVYEPDYISPSFVVLNDSVALLNITAEHPFYNAYNSYSFYNTGYAVAVVDLKKNRIVELFGKRKGIYHQKHFIPFFHSALLAYDKKNGNIFITYEADSLIYVYDKHFKLLSTLGNKSKYFNDEYPLHKTIASAFDVGLMTQEREHYGRNIKLFAGESAPYLVRYYQSGIVHNEQSTNRVQIYKANIYLKDILLPYSAIAIGVKDETLYAAKIMSEKENEVIIYKINLN